MDILYRVMIEGPIGTERNNGGPSPVHGPSCIFIVTPVVQVHALLQTLQCLSLHAPGEVDGDLWVILSHSVVKQVLYFVGFKLGISRTSL